VNTDEFLIPSYHSSVQSDVTPAARRSLCPLLTRRRPAPDGKPYPSLAQHALRQAKVLAGNIVALMNGQSPQPFVYDTLGMMGSLGHSKAFGQLFKLRVCGFLA
jgi:NADH dehydrogenase